MHRTSSSVALLRIPGLVAIVALALTLGLALPVHAAEPTDVWPQWRGPGGRGHAPGHTVPMTWDESTIAWKTAIEGRGLSSPIVWEDRVFVTTAIEGEVIPGAAAPDHTLGGQPFRHPASLGADKSHTFKVLALDTESGEIVWSKTAYDGRVFDDRHSASSYASPTPATDGERVYAYFGSEGVYAYDFAGELVWSADIGDIKTVGLGVGTSPVLWGDLLIIVADEDSGDQSFIVALDKRTGKQVWRKERPVQVSWGTPLVVDTADGRTQLLTTGFEHVISYDPATGEELWRADGLQNNAIHMPMVHGKLAIFTSGYPEKITMAIPLDKAGDLGDTRAWTYTKGTAYVPSNLLVDGLLYLTNDGGVLTCLDAATGEVVYEGGRFPERTRFMASLLQVGDQILMISNDGQAAFIALGREFEVTAQTSLGENVLATPAVAGNRLYVRSEQHLYAIGPGTTG
ncbi:MAG TPA: PQQ-binding-like beta-propeller repeat protein [Thermoanaerobaculia bacterium]|nr:PQQ-binding-like beta-propeller repeat protein [Thermoanaerobaculia bacterium]